MSMVRLFVVGASIFLWMIPTLVFYMVLVKYLVDGLDSLSISALYEIIIFAVILAAPSAVVLAIRYQKNKM